jgi:hypothetical protein
LQLLIDKFLESLPVTLFSLGSLIAVARWTLKPYIEGKIKAENDGNLATLTSNLNRLEERFKADLREKDNQIAALRSGALSVASERYASLEKRRLQALEELWRVVLSRRPHRNLVGLMERVRVDFMLDLAGKDSVEAEKIVQFAEFILRFSGVDLQKQMEDPSKERIFIPEPVWAAYSSYSGVLAYFIAMFLAIIHRQRKDILVDPKDLLEAAKVSLPKDANFIDQHGITALPLIIRDLEENVFQKILAALTESSHDQGQIDAAHKIIQAAENMLKPQEINPGDIPESIRK